MVGEDCGGADRAGWDAAGVGPWIWGGNEKDAFEKSGFKILDANRYTLI